MLYIVQRNDCKNFSIASDIDKEYAKYFKDAFKRGVQILAYNCNLSNLSINIRNKLRIRMLK